MGLMSRILAMIYLGASILVYPIGVTNIVLSYQNGDVYVCIKSIFYVLMYTVFMICELRIAISYHRYRKKKQREDAKRKELHINECE